MPPLRERQEDIPLLVRFFLNKYSKIHGKGIRKISRQIMRAFEEYTWPGNVRELVNVIERAVIVSDGPELRLAGKIDAPAIDAAAPTLSEDTGSQKTEGLTDAERRYILERLHETGWRIEGPGGAARLLGMNPSTLRTRMRKLRIKRPGTHQ
jgi:DNA-binding NtrC family response regulator